MTEVTQADRELVAGIIEEWGLMSGLTVEHIRRGLYDCDRILRMAADHRNNPLPEQGK